jgi:hypothetical protein
MKKRLSLRRETLFRLTQADAVRVLGGIRMVHETYDSGETYCWCSRGCPPQSDGCPDPEPVETSGCHAA